MASATGDRQGARVTRPTMRDVREEERARAREVALRVTRGATETAMETATGDRWRRAASIGACVLLLVASAGVGAWVATSE